MSDGFRTLHQVARQKLDRLWRGAPAEEEVFEDLTEKTLPIVWLLGKTGSGKSSLIRSLTGLSGVDVGNGYEPCTKTSEKFDYPSEQPLLRFLDTRGLGETGYDPAEDLSYCEGHAHAALVLCRLDDPVQGEVADAVRRALRGRKDFGVLLVQTGADLLPDAATLQRMRSTNSEAIMQAAGRSLEDVVIALPPDGSLSPESRDELIDHLSEILPQAALLLARKETLDAESRAFESVRKRVLFYASAAGATDLAPIAGAITVPAAQLAMLRELGNRYNVPWTRQTMASFTAALGLGVAARFGGGYLLRQLGKLVPVYGQTVGAALSGSLSFATTYALGRVAARFLHARAGGETPSREDLQRVYREAFTRAQHAPD